jgi:hypothetical protein
MGHCSVGDAGRDKPQVEKRTVKEAKASSWRRAIAATAYKQKDLWRLERWAKLRN